jgi:hypothetical protein
VKLPGRLGIYAADPKENKEMQERHKQALKIAIGLIFSIVLASVSFFVIVDKLHDYDMEQAGLSEKQIQQGLAKDQIHIAKVMTIYSHMEALNRLTALKGKARTEKERALVRSEVAKLRESMAASETEFNGKLVTAIEKDLDEIVEMIN